MTVTFAKPGGATTKKRAAGGDNEVPRDSKDRPRIVSRCQECNETGRVPSEKRPGNTIQCPKCKGKGTTERSYTRVTTYIDVLEDKSSIEAWGKRKVLIGVARDGSMTEGALDWDDATEEGRNWLNRRAEKAADKGGANERSEKGTQLHDLSEIVDEGGILPWREMSFEDTLDMQAYEAATKSFEIIHMEKLVVNDELRVAGTPDRVSRWSFGPDGELLVTPDGEEIGPDEALITDLKTGRVDYGALKMAMQLSLYSRSKLYDHKTHERAELVNVNQKWGIIMHLPAGSGECTLYWANLDLGWAAVGLAGQVREMRNRGKKALVRLDNAA